jgi:acetyl esterase
VELHEAVRDFLATKPDSGDPAMDPADRRTLIHRGSDEVFARFGRPAAPVHDEQDVTLAVGGGQIRLRVYRPGAATGLPLHVFLHGGGFWLGSIDEDVNQAICRDRSRATGCVVVAVDYRLGPEHRFPVPLEDCYAGLLWATGHAEQIGADAGNVSVGGVSAGANLAAAVALLARDRSGPVLRLQVLEVPLLDLTLATMAGSAVGDEYGITAGELRLCTDLYLPAADDAHRPYASPLLAPSLAELPPAHIMTAEFDPLRRDGEQYADRLTEAGVPVSSSAYLGAVHGSLALTGAWAGATAWHHDLAEALREAHHPGRST